MAVTSFGKNMGVDGHRESIKAFRRSHVENTEALLNLADGKEVDEARPAYDPSHPDNQWPVMVHHPVKGEMPVGTNLVGVQDEAARKRIATGNKKALSQAIEGGYRLEPFPKPHLTVHDPAVEKAELLRKNAELQGQITNQQDVLLKMEARLALLESPAKSPDSPAE